MGNLKDHLQAGISSTCLEVPSHHQPFITGIVEQHFQVHLGGYLVKTSRLEYSIGVLLHNEIRENIEVGGQETGVDDA
jgi:hypothetical protein